MSSGAGQHHPSPGRAGTHRARSDTCPLAAAQLQPGAGSRIGPMPAGVGEQPQGSQRRRPRETPDVGPHKPCCGGGTLSGCSSDYLLCRVPGAAALPGNRRVTIRAPSYWLSSWGGPCPPGTGPPALSSPAQEQHPRLLPLSLPGARRGDGRRMGHPAGAAGCADPAGSGGRQGCVRALGLWGGGFGGRGGSGVPWTHGV